MAYDNITSRTDVSATIPEDVSNEMLGTATEQSLVLSTFRHIPCRGKDTRFPILSALPVAYWVNGDTGLKQTTEIAWANKYLHVEEVAAILPVPENVVDDMQMDLWGEAKPLLSEAVGRLVDSTVFFGTNAPGTFPTNILAAATAAGNTVTEGATAANGKFYGDVDGLYEKVEGDGFRVTGFVGDIGVKSKLRKSRDSTGQKLDSTRTSGDLATIDGIDIKYGMDGLWPENSGDPELFAGAWREFVVGVRKDITWKVLDQAVIQDNTGNIVFNLAQQDMIALRLTFRMGWQVSNRINHKQPTEGSRYPVAALLRP